MSTPNGSVVNPNQPGQNPVSQGVAASGGWGSALSSLVQLPGQWLTDIGAGQQASNAQNAVSGNLYQNASGNITTSPYVANPNPSTFTFNGTNYSASGDPIGNVTTPVSTGSTGGNQNALNQYVYVNGVNGLGQMLPGYQTAQQVQQATPPDVASQVNTTQPVTSGTTGTSTQDVQSSMANNISAYMNGMANNQAAADAHNQYMTALNNYQNFNTNLTASEMAQYGVGGRPITLAGQRASQIGFQNQIESQTLQNQVNSTTQNQNFALGQQQIQEQVGQNALQDLLTQGGQNLTQAQINQSAYQYANMSAQQQAAYNLQYFQTLGTMPPASITSGQGTAGTTGGATATPTALTANGTTPNMTATDMVGYDISSYATDPNYASEIASSYQQATSTIGSTISPQSIQNYINQVAPNAPVTGQMIYNAALNGGGTGVPVDPYLLAAQEAHESQFGTQGAATGTMNPGNVGNTGTSTQPMASWQAGVNANAAWLAKHPAQGQNNAPAKVQAPTLIQPAVQTLSDGTSYIDADKLSTTSQKTLAQIYSAQSGVPVLTGDEVSKVQNIDITNQNLSQITALLPQILGSGLGGRIQGLVGNQLQAALQSNPQIASFQDYRTVALNSIQALAGGSGSGFRLNAGEIEAATQNLPTITDNLETAQSKLNILNGYLAKWENELLPNQSSNTNPQTPASQPSQIVYQGTTYNVDANGNMTPA